MKNICSLFMIGTLFLITSCDKEATELNPNANAAAAFIHAAPGAPAVDIVVDGLVSNGSRRLTYGVVSAGGGTGNGGAYIPLLSGSRNIKISPDSGRTNVIDLTVPFDVNKPYTIIAYDTLSAARNSLLGVRLSDDLAVPAAGNIHARVVHAAPLGPAVDITFVRLVSSVPTDSVTISNKTYLGATPDATALSAFSPIRTGSYILRVKAAGTQNVLLNNFPLGTNFGTTGRIFTVTVIGTAAGRPLTAVLLRHL